MSANSVLPPADGITRADSSEYFAGTALNELSECHSRLPSENSRRRSSRDRTWPLLSRLEMSLTMAARRRSLLQFAKIAAERELRCVGEMLVMEHQHAEPVHAGGDRLRLFGGERAGDVDAGDLAGEERAGGGVDWPDGEG